MSVQTTLPSAAARSCIIEELNEYRERGYKELTPDDVLSLTDNAMLAAFSSDSRVLPSALQAARDKAREAVFLKHDTMRFSIETLLHDIWQP